MQNVQEEKQYSPQGISIENKTWSDVEDLGNGIFVYRDVLKPSMNIVSRMEEILSNNTENYKWRDALVGYQQKMPEYRDCVDFKFKKTDIQHDSSEASLKLQQIWQECYDAQAPAVQDYANKHRLYDFLRYWEAFNFIKYGPGQHFQEHHDHGYSYNCVVSLVGYFNDDYEGGELFFSRQNLMLKPKAGDLYIFPSNYIYPHRAMPVKSGIKYSLVTMLDYSAKFHDPKFYQETGN
ncbi:hypothetical protein EBU71_02360 [bacterium]|nr:hypothetical protein [Candidatus Elulimicrobium humile]